MYVYVYVYISSKASLLIRVSYRLPAFCGKKWRHKREHLVISAVALQSRMDHAPKCYDAPFCFRVGRKKVVIGGLVVGAIANLLVTVIPTDPGNAGTCSRSLSSIAGNTHFLLWKHYCYFFISLLSGLLNSFACLFFYFFHFSFFPSFPPSLIPCFLVSSFIHSFIHSFPSFLSCFLIACLFVCLLACFPPSFFPSVLSWFYFDLSFFPLSYHTIPYHTIPNHTIPYHRTPHHTTPHHNTAHHSTPHHTPHHSTPHHTGTLRCSAGYHGDYKLCCLFPGYAAARIIFAMFGKLFIMCSFDAIFVFSAELFPTVVR